MACKTPKSKLNRMKAIPAVLALLLATAYPAVAQEPASAPQAVGAAALVHVQARVVAIDAASNSVALRGPRGNVETKASFVADIVSPQLVIEPYAVEDFDIRVYGDTALLSGRTRMTGSYEGKAFTSHYRYTDVYVKRAGRWQVVSVQISKIP